MDLNDQLTWDDLNPEYDAFVEKFKPKKTTDDCYTPANIMQAINTWVSERYDVNPENFVRPFYPGGNYQSFDYPEGAIVVDNPPFSILTQIRRWYLAHGIKYFMFAPSLTCLSSQLGDCAIVCDAKVIYQNGACVQTSFVTNMEPEYSILSAPDSHRILHDEIAKSTGRNAGAALPKYDYPDNIVTAAMVQRFAHWGVDYRLRKDEAVPIRTLDAQRGKTGIFGTGYLLSSEAAVAKVAAGKAAEKAQEETTGASPNAAKVWELSARELQIVAALDARRLNQS